MLVLTVTKNLDKLLKNCRLTSVTFLGKLGGVVVMAINLSIVLIVAVLGAKDSGTKRACEMVNVIFAFQGRDVGSPEGTTTLIAEQAESSKIICLAEGVLTLAVVVVGGEELGCDDLTTVLGSTLQH